MEYIVVYLGEYAFPEFAGIANDEKSAIEMAYAHAKLTGHPIKDELTGRDEKRIQLYTRNTESFYSYLVMPDSHYSLWVK